MMPPCGSDEEDDLIWGPGPKGEERRPSLIGDLRQRDGSVIRDQHQAAAGGILRDHSGRRLACFAVNLGECTIMRAELRAAAFGFRIAWELGFKKVHLQMDSLAVVNDIRAEDDRDGRHSLLIISIREWRNRDWE
ncbi:Putative ribonuclease H protein At1g65750, partial [Linum perenne]